MLLKRKTGDEKFCYNNKDLPFSLLDFWQWSGSDIINNTNRGILAEYLVATALGVTNKIRIEWGPYDLEYAGLNLEVKSAAYIQSWNQKKLSEIIFNIEPKSRWDNKSRQYSKKRARPSHFYIFCVLKEKIILSINPVNLDQWDFYIIPTYLLNSKLGSQKRIGLKKLINIGSVVSSYEDIRKIIDDIFVTDGTNILKCFDIEF